MTDTTREAFEQHIRDSIVSEVGTVLALNRDEYGDYATLWVDNRWRAYQAATERATAAERERAAKLAYDAGMDGLAHAIRQGGTP